MTIMMIECQLFKIYSKIKDMNLQIGSNNLFDVEVPILWGKRAIVQDRLNRISIINLSGISPVIEVLGDKPAPNMGYKPSVRGFILMDGNKELYEYDPKEKRVLNINLGRLPDVGVSPDEVDINGSTFRGNAIIGAEIGIVIDENGGFGMGARMPQDLARLSI